MDTIGILIPEYPGQTHSFFWREIEALNNAYGIKAKVISTRLPKQAVYHEWSQNHKAFYLLPIPLPQIPEILITVFRALPALLINPITRSLLFSIKNWRLLPVVARLRTWCLANSITHLHVHSCANSALVATFNKVMTKTPYSIVLHGPISDYGEFQYQKWVGADFCIVITEQLRKEVLRLFPDLEKKIFIAPMGVDIDIFKPSPTRPENSNGEFKWFCCARLNRVKGLEDLLSAARTLKETYPDLKFKIEIAGEDEQGGMGYHQFLNEKIVELGLSNSVTLLGAISQMEVLRHLQEADAFVLPSKNEPLGVAYMEAMACGLAVIGTDAGGVSELISDGIDGILVPPEQPAKLAEAMSRVMIDAELRANLGRMAVQKIHADFSSKKSAAVLAGQLDRTHRGDL